MKYDIEQDQILLKIRNAIMEAVAPDKIILFGSRARGEKTAQSDYDLLVIKDDIENERDIARQIKYKLLDEHIGQSVDVLVASTETWNRNVDRIGMIYRTIEAEGITLYE